MRRIAIYGGTFDPVHNGHLEVARQARRLFELDEVIFVPAYVPPHKRNAKITSAYHRFAMLALAAQTDQRLLVSTLELDAPEHPYAVDTVAEMAASNRRLFFLIGADSWAEITTWHEWQKLLQLCDLIVVTRPGYEIGIPSVEAKVVDLRGKFDPKVIQALHNQTARHVFITDVANVDVSATSIRARVANFAEIGTMVPPAVAEYIEKHGLYKN